MDTVTTCVFLVGKSSASSAHQSQLHFLHLRSRSVSVTHVSLKSVAENVYTCHDVHPMCSVTCPTQFLDI